MVVVLIGCVSCGELSDDGSGLNLCRQNLTDISPSTELIRKAPSTVEHITLCENNITTVNPSSFQKLDGLEKLILDNNEYLNFPSNGSQFIYQGSLTDFLCFRCGVDKIYNKSLAGMPRLEQINLTENKITHIEGGAFQGNGNLKVIELRRNLLQRVPREMVETLEHILKVDLSFNNELAPEGDQPFLISDALEELWCIQCGFETVDKRTFSVLVNLKVLYLENNKITQVHARAFDQITLRRSDSGTNLLVSLENNNLKRIVSEVKAGLQLCLHNNTIELECFLRDIPDKDSFVCRNSTHPEVECIPPTTTTLATTLTTESSRTPTISATIFSTIPINTDPRQAANNPATSPASTTPTPVKPPEEVYGISDAYISGYLTLLYVAQIIGLAMLSVVWFRLKKSDSEVDRYAETIVNPNPNYRAIQ